MSARRSRCGEAEVCGEKETTGAANYHPTPDSDGLTFLMMSFHFRVPRFWVPLWMSETGGILWVLEGGSSLKRGKLECRMFWFS